MELLFSNQPTHTLTLPRLYDPRATLLAPSSPAPSEPPAPRDSGTETDVRFLVWWLREFLLEDRDRPELFSQGDTVCVPSPLSSLGPFPAQPLVVRRD